MRRAVYQGTFCEDSNVEHGRECGLNTEMMTEMLIKIQGMFCAEEQSWKEQTVVSSQVVGVHVE